MTYLELTTSKAWLLSEVLYRLTRPAATRTDKDVSTRYCLVVDHPSSGKSILCLPDSATLPLHKLLDSSEMYRFLDRFVADAERDTVIAKCREGSVTLRELLPDTLFDARITKSEALIRGYEI